MVLTGKLEFLSKEIEVTPTYFKRDLVIETDEKYPQFITVEFPNKVCSDYLGKISIGDKICVSVNIEGRRVNTKDNGTKYFNSIKGWRVDKISNGSV